MKISTEYPTCKKDNLLLSVITKSVQTTKKSVIDIPLIVKIHLILQFRGRFRGGARGVRPPYFLQSLRRDEKNFSDLTFVRGYVNHFRDCFLLNWNCFI